MPPIGLQRSREAFVVTFLSLLEDFEFFINIVQEVPVMHHCPFASYLFWGFMYFMLVAYKAMNRPVQRIEPHWIPWFGIISMDTSIKRHWEIVYTWKPLRCMRHIHAAPRMEPM